MLVSAIAALAVNALVILSAISIFPSFGSHKEFVCEDDLLVLPKRLSIRIYFYEPSNPIKLKILTSNIEIMCLNFIWLFRSRTRFAKLPTQVSTNVVLFTMLAVATTGLNIFAVRAFLRDYCAAFFNTNFLGKMYPY